MNYLKNQQENKDERTGHFGSHSSEQSRAQIHSKDKRLRFVIPSKKQIEFFNGIFYVPFALSVYVTYRYPGRNRLSD